MIVELPNIYANEKKSTDWNDVTYDGITDFLALHFLMGLIKLPTIRDYWSSDFRISYIANHIYRDRFISIRNNLHFVNKSTHNNSQKPFL